MAEIKKIKVGNSTYDVRDTNLSSTDTSSKIYLTGATSQSSGSIKHYSDNEVYTTSGVLTTKSVQVGGGNGTIQYNASSGCVEIIC